MRGVSRPRAKGVAPAADTADTWGPPNTSAGARRQRPDIPYTVSKTSSPAATRSDAPIVALPARLPGAAPGHAPGAGAVEAALAERVRELEAQVEALEEAAERRLEGFAQTSSGWFWQTGPDQRFSYFSKSVEAITGIPREWHYGKTREEIGAPDAVSPAQWRAHLARLQRHEPFHDFMFRRQGPNGVAWMKTSGAPIFDDEGRFQGYCGIASDVTAQVEAQSAAERLLFAVETLDEIFVLWDPDDRLVMCNGRFREINRAVADATCPGTPFEEHVRAALAAGLYPQAAGREDEWLADRLRRHREPDGPILMERQDGRWLQINEYRLPDGSCATISADVTESRRADRALADSRRVLQAALETVPDGVMVLDEDLELVAYNAHLWRVTGIDEDTVTGAPRPGHAMRRELARLGAYGDAADGDLDALVASREVIARARQPVHYERQLRDGRWIECRGEPVKDGGYLVVYRDVDESRRMQLELERLASYDELTALPNRRSFMATLGQAQDRLRDGGAGFALLLIDVDYFKRVNDRYGHAVGDRALRVLGRTLKAVLRDEDTPGRLGGEEFAALLPGATRDNAVAAAERVREAVAAAAVEVRGDSLRVTVSIGVAQAAPEIGIQELMRVADERLYAAKGAGRNRVMASADGSVGEEPAGPAQSFASASAAPE